MRIPWLRAARAVGEIVVAVLCALVLVWLSDSIDVDPLNRIGQVSGLAGVQLRYGVLAAVLIVAAVAAIMLLPGAARDSPRRDIVLGLSCAAAAGLAGGAAAGGIVVALRGTPWGLNALGGDGGKLIGWANDVLAGRPLPDTYPPLPAHLIAWLSRLLDKPPEYGMRDFQILGVALIAPLGYLSWRLLLTPVWALVVGATSALALVDAYKPYPNEALIVLVPVLAKALLALRTAGRHGYVWALVVGAVAGAALGVLFQAYFGWFLWSGPGFAVALIVAVPWRDRRGLLKAGVFIVGAVGVFFAITHQVLIAVLTKGSQETDQYFYFDTDVRPTYFEHWFDDRPPPGLGPWPVPGGLGGVDIFAVLLFIGLGLALVLGSRRIEVLLIATLIGGAWLLRFLLASRMYVTQSVQLYPRTSVELLYGFLLATGLTVMLVVRHTTTLTARFRTMLGGGSAVALRFRAGATAGLLTGTLLLLASMADTVGDDYMPRDDAGNGQLAYRAYTSFELDGSCPQFMEPSGALCRYLPPTSTPNGTPIVLPQH